MAGFLAALIVGPIAAQAVASDFDDPASGDTSQQFGVDNVQRQDTPNDPGYDPAEPDHPQGPTTNSVFDEDFGYFGFPSQRTRNTAVYATGPNALACQPDLLVCPQISGFNASGAWKLERGRPDTTIAILDTGIKWDRGGLRTQIHLNRGELPTPSGAGAPCPDQNPDDTYDCDGDGAFNVDDYADSSVDKSIGPHGIAGTIDAADLIAAFSNGADSDSNGFVDDIAGWDFFNNDNDPYDASSYFAAENHGSGRAGEAAERGNDSSGDIGLCPHCQLMPIRAWDTFVTDGNNFGMGMVYATDNGASVIEGANGSTYHSAFAEQASNYAYEHGVAQMYSGDDLNTGNHNYVANYGHAQLILGTVPDTMGLGADGLTFPPEDPTGFFPDPPPELEQLSEGFAGLCDSFNPPQAPVGCHGGSLPVGTYFRSANTDQYGGKGSISMEGTTGSENTGKASGAAALVISSAMGADPPIDLRPDETREILEQTAERVLNGNTGGTGTPDPAADPTAASENQWTAHFGWGRVDLGKAVALARSGEIPPEAAIDSPDWYAPVTGDSIDITGLARARFADAGSFHWKLEWGLGEAPTSWNMVDQGDSTSDVTDFGTVDLDAVRSALATFVPPPDPAGPTLSTASQNPYAKEFVVRLIVTGDGIPTRGIDRRVFTSAEDDTLRDGFPKRMGTGGEAPIRYADLDGDNAEELIVPTEDGTVHAYEPDGSELPGWPVHTQLQRSALDHDTAPGFNDLEADTPPREPLRGAAVADLDDDGVPEIIDTAGIHIYVWEPDGSLRPGFPVASDLTLCEPSLGAETSQTLHHPKCGFLSSPAIGHLEGKDESADIVIPSLDGHLYAIDGEGNDLPGFPRPLVDPDVASNKQMIAESINEPALVDLNGDGKDDIVAASNETYEAETPDPSCPGSGDAGELIAQAAGGSSRVYAVDGATGDLLPGWPIHLNGAIQDTLPLIGPGQNPSVAKIGGETTIVASTTGTTGINEYDTSGSLVRCIQQGVYGPASDATDRSGVLNLFESASIGKLLPSDPDLDVVKYGLSLSDVANLLLTGQNVPYNHLIGAFNAQTGATLPAFPRITDDFQFLSASNIAKVDNSLPGNQVIAGTGLGLLHAYDGTAGVDAPGFPKVTGGWLFAPAALSEDGRIADITREGFLFEWDLANVSDPACQSEWPSFRHDNQQSGNYDRDGMAPGSITDADFADAGGEPGIKLTAPGDDLNCGTASAYQLVTSDSPVNGSNFGSGESLPGAPAPAAQGTEQTFQIPEDARRYLAIRAVDDQGNVDRAVTFDRGEPPVNDGDNDGHLDDADNCPSNYNPDQSDLDHDGQGDVCDPDDDADGVDDSADNCPVDANPGQSDLDDDGQGDVCDADDDGDGADDVADNCPVDANPGQADNDGDGIGNACDPTPDPPGDGDSGGEGDEDDPGGPPDTQITQAAIARHGASFEFDGTGGQSPLSFECKLKRPHRRGQGNRRPSFIPCSSPAAFDHLRPGRYRFLVRAVDAAGQADATPTLRSFRIAAR